MYMLYICYCQKKKKLDQHIITTERFPLYVAVLLEPLTIEFCLSYQITHLGLRIHTSVIFQNEAILTQYITIFFSSNTKYKVQIGTYLITIVLACFFSSLKMNRKKFRYLRVYVFLLLVFNKLGQKYPSSDCHDLLMLFPQCGVIFIKKIAQ